MPCAYRKCERKYIFLALQYFVLTIMSIFQQAICYDLYYVNVRHYGFT